MHILLDATRAHRKFLPLTFACPIGALRVGMLTLQSKWEHYSGLPVSHLAPQYLQEVFAPGKAEDYLICDATLLPDASLVKFLLQLPPESTCVDTHGQILAAHTSRPLTSPKKTVIYPQPLSRIERPWDIFKANAAQIEADIQLLNPSEISEKLKSENTVFGQRIFATGEVNVRGAILNSETGPILLEAGSEIMEGCVVRGPLALCTGATLKLSAKVYGATTLGPHCKAGGELSNVVMQGYSNKGHDGFLGNSVIGKWCNIGADTNSSNLKNNYSEVRCWSYEECAAINTGEQFCGLIMGDHGKTGINTMLNTGTAVGFSANIFGADFPPKHIPSFSWGGASGFARFDLEKALEVAHKMMERRHVEMTAAEEKVFRYLYTLDQEGK
jgi:UDP-N-acetylglucosamine diphosphorylase/glucosamine-1-phosphate N-acetyltransferase